MKMLVLAAAIAAALPAMAFADGVEGALARKDLYPQAYAFLPKGNLEICQTGLLTDVMCKLVVLANALLRDNRKWSETRPKIARILTNFGPNSCLKIIKMHFNLNYDIVKN